MELASCTHLGIRRQLLDIVSVAGTVLSPDKAGLTVYLILLGEAVAPLVHHTAHRQHAPQWHEQAQVPVVATAGLQDKNASFRAKAVGKVVPGLVPAFHAQGLLPDLVEACAAR